MFAGKDGDDVLESKTGDNAEISFLLLSMLQRAGIPCCPVILSTRSNGSIQKVYPLVSQFNYVLCKAIVNGTPLYLDPTDPLRPMNLLPRKVLNVEGLEIQEGPLSWVKLTSTRQYVHRSVATVTLHEDGTMDGTLESADEDYSALDKRRGLKDKKEMEIIKEAFNTEETGMTVDSVHIMGRDSIDTGLKLWAHVASDQYANVAGNLIYINPLVIDRKKSNPFKVPVRKFPVDMAYGTRTLTVVNVEIPKGYVIKEQPPDRTLSMQKEALTYTRKCLVDNNRVQVLSDLAIKWSYFAPNEYQRLRNFYAEMLNLQNDQIVLQRAGPPTGAHQ